MRQLTLGVQLKERATFASFLTARNQELVTHLKHVAASCTPGATWLAGPHTAGKSHLLQAVCADVAPGRRAAYLPLETLLPFGPGTLDGAEALDVACYDDIQAIAGLRRMGATAVCVMVERAGTPHHAAVRGTRESGARGIRAPGPEVAPGVVGDLRGARAQRRGAVAGAGPARATARLRAAGRDRALPAAKIPARHAHACAKSSTRSTMPRSRRSAGSPCHSYARTSIVQSDPGRA